jgi:hypothetical protein
MQLLAFTRYSENRTMALNGGKGRWYFQQIVPPLECLSNFIALPLKSRPEA